MGGRRCCRRASSVPTTPGQPPLSGGATTKALPPDLGSTKRSRSPPETLTGVTGRRRLRRMELSVCVTDDDYEAWRAIRIAVVPDERCDTVAELRAQDSSGRLLLLAVEDGAAVVGSGMADKSETAGGGFAAPRVLPEHRRRGVGSALLV